MRFHNSTLLALPLLLTSIRLAQGGVLTPTVADPFDSTWQNHKPGDPYVYYRSSAVTPGEATIGIGRIAIRPESVSRNEDSFLGAALAPVDLTDRPRWRPTFLPKSSGKATTPSTFSLSATQQGEQGEAMEFYSLSGLGTTSALSSSTAGVSTMVVTPSRTSTPGSSSWSTLSAVKLSW